MVKADAAIAESARHFSLSYVEELHCIVRYPPTLLGEVEGEIQLP